MKSIHAVICKCACIALAITLSSCGTPLPPGGTRGNMGSYPTQAQRNAQIANEPTGNFYYGRRYYVEKTRFWGYLRKPRQPWSKAKLVMMNESLKRNPDRLNELGPEGARYGYDQNHEYIIYGRYTGRMIVDPNSDFHLPEFQLTGYKKLNTNPGWLFSPSDAYDPTQISLLNRIYKY